MILRVVIFLVALVSCFEGPKVTQGKVKSIDTANFLLTVEDERAPNEEITFYYRGAEMGGEPQAGAIVRVAWREENGIKVAKRIMNVSRQEEGASPKK